MSIEALLTNVAFKNGRMVKFGAHLAKAMD
jgi:hypothetical protein